MPFQELLPTKKSRGTGVRVSQSDRNGLVVTLSGAALAALHHPKRVRVLIDPDPALPRLRIVAANTDGTHALSPAPGRRKAGEAEAPDATTMLLRLGHNNAFGEADFKGLDCTWEVAEIEKGTAIDIDLPREMQSMAVVSKAVTAPSTTYGNRRQTSVTLPQRRG